MGQRRWITARLGAIAVLVAACGASKKSALPASTTTTTSSTTSTTRPLPPISPLTGLAQPDAAELSRVALVIKIDNVDAARPQAGLAAADDVYEEQVEGLLTRLIAVFQSTDASRVGPVRSTRTTDIDVVSSLNHPLYAYSGGNTNYVAQLDAAPITDVGYVADPNAYLISGPNDAPHNLYTSTEALFALAPPGSGPPPLFAYRAAGQAPTNAGAAPASKVSLTLGQVTAAWAWDASSQTWLRDQDGTPDVLEGGGQIAATNVVVQFIPYVTDGYATGEGINPPPPIPKGLTVGTGTAVIFTGGMMIKAEWSKASPNSVTQFTDSSGQPILMAPGRTWIELAPAGTSLSLS